MGAVTLARLIGLEALRRPRSILAAIMLALSAGFLILPDASADYATLTFKGQRLAYTPAVMGFISGAEFVAFSLVLVTLAMSAMVPMRSWRAVFGVVQAPSWRLALGAWMAAFAAGAFLLACIFSGGLVRGWDVLGADGQRLYGLWTYFTWTFGLGIVGAGLAALAYSVFALRMAGRPGLLMGAAFLAWIALLLSMILSGLDLAGQDFARDHMFQNAQKLDLGIGLLGGMRSHATVATLPVGDLFTTPGGGAFVASRVGYVVGAALTAAAAAGPRLAPLDQNGRRTRAAGPGQLSRLVAAWGLNGVLFGQTWGGPFWALVLALVTMGVQAANPGSPLAVIALGFGWGLFMLRWPELCEAFEHGALRSLVQPSVLGPWRVRALLFGQIVLQMTVLALPLLLSLLVAGSWRGLGWLGIQILAGGGLCVGLGRLRGGATLFSLAALVWWYLLVSGDVRLPAG